MTNSHQNTKVERNLKPNDKISLSVVINTKNAAQTLPATLTSVAFANEVIVADMHSTDNTVALAKQAQSKIMTVADSKYVEPARNAAIAKASGSWILVVDADEIVPANLRELILSLISNENRNSKIHAYAIARSNKIFNKYMTATGWWPDYQVRLFQKGSVSYSNAIHGIPKIVGQVEHLPAQHDLALWHNNYQSVEQFIEKMDRYTTVEAQASPANKPTAAELIAVWRREFLARMFASDGWQDGTHGVALSILQANYPFLTQLKLWQKAGFASNSSLSKQQESTWQGFVEWRQELAYWLANTKVEQTTGLVKLYWLLRRKWRI